MIYFVFTLFLLILLIYYLRETLSNKFLYNNIFYIVTIYIDITMAIRTSAITYRRGISNDQTNFFFVAQSNNIIPAPMSGYLSGYQFYNSNIVNTSYRWPWRG